MIDKDVEKWIELSTENKDRMFLVNFLRTFHARKFGKVQGYIDSGLLIIGGMFGYFLIDLEKGVEYMLELPPIVLLFVIASAIYYVGKMGPSRLPADVVTGFAIGLSLRSEHIF